MGRVARGLFLFLPAAMLLAQVPDMSGTWKLNVNKSRWGNKAKPAGVVLTIQHKEPKLTVSGTIADDREQTSSFHYDSAIGGPPESGPDGTLTLRRIDERTLESVWQSTDGRYTERGRTTLARNGRELKREVHLKRPDGEFKWTEVYDKQ